MHELEAYIHQHIPISKAMGITVREASLDHVTLEAPLAANVNHQGTAFGGSIAAIATLAGWGLVWMRMQASFPGAAIVVRRESVEFNRPVVGDLRTTCQATESLDGLMLGIERRGKGRCELETCVLTGDGEIGAILRAEFAVSVSPTGASSP